MPIPANRGGAVRIDEEADEAARFGLTRKPMRASPLASKRVSASKGLAIDVGRGELRCSCGVKKLDSAGAGCW
jgi:hypothetical protein